MNNALKMFLVLMIALTGFFCSPLSVFSQQPPMDRVDLQNQAAEDWLALVDQGQYEESWGAASAVLKQAVTAAQWESTLNSTRSQLGGRLTRGLDARTEDSSIEGFPDGEYVILGFSSSFANDPQAVETLTIKLDSDGVWRVVAYSIT